MGFLIVIINGNLLTLAQCSSKFLLNPYSTPLGISFVDVFWPSSKYAICSAVYVFNWTVEARAVGTTKPTVSCWLSGSIKTGTRAHPRSCSNPGYPSQTAALAEPCRSVKNNEKLPWTASPVIGDRVSARNDYSLPLAGFERVTRLCASFVGTTKPAVDC